MGIIVFYCFFLKKIEKLAVLQKLSLIIFWWKFLLVYEI